MEKEFLKKQKEKLEEEKKKLEKRLSSFARQSKKAKGGWETSIPIFDGGGLEEEADEVEEYGTLLALEKTLEEELQKIKLALKKIKKGGYGICERCQKPISQARLEVYPQANYCTKCQ
ncbi:MAG: TraR/DksA C4-type zinc finger protein [Patescibacteria group bacterium]|nr:TraR/DksA C4-type zinc finger protein [Patescibacteria group bacterium]